MDQGAGDEHPPRFAGRHFAHRTLGQVRYLELRQGGVGQFAVPGIDHVMREDASAAEETGQDHVTPAGFAGALGQKIVRHNAQQRTQFENIPAVLPQDGHRGTFPRHGITFPRNGLDQGGLAAAVRPQNGHMFVAADHQAEIFQHSFLSAHHGDILQIQ